MFIWVDKRNQVEEVKVKIKANEGIVYYLIESERSSSVSGIYGSDEILYAAPDFRLNFLPSRYYYHEWVVHAACREIDLDHESVNKLFCEQLKRKLTVL